MEIEGLREGIERAKLNISIFRVAIDKELDTIEDYKRMILHLESQEIRGKDGSSSESNS